MFPRFFGPDIALYIPVLIYDGGEKRSIIAEIGAKITNSSMKEKMQSMPHTNFTHSCEAKKYKVERWRNSVTAIRQIHHLSDME